MTTEEYPGFATDLQAQYMALMTQAEGIADHRGAHLREPLHARAGAGAHGREHPRRRRARPSWRGRAPLTGAGVIACDLRASASLVLAALVAQGETVIDRVYHIDRGYENIEEKLAAAGAKIRRVE